MGRVFAVLALVLACGGKKEPPAPASGTAGSAVAVVADAASSSDAPSRPVELLHQYWSSVEVSSHVMNKSIKPEHLVDKNFETAWNSKTGELAGAWLDVYVPGASIEELRFTVGHTGKGPKGQDYFTMNPRIKKISILESETVLLTVTLDPERRELQAIKLPKPSAHTLRIRIDEVVMGTKKTWREVCISELEAWGTPAPDKPPSPHTPVVSVWQPAAPPPTEIVRGKPMDVFALCESIVTPLQEAFEQRMRNERDNDYGSEDAPPECGLQNDTPIKTGPWRSVSVWRLAYNSAHGPMSCNLVAHTEHGDFMIGDERACGPWDDEHLELKSAVAEDVMPGREPELVVHLVGARADVPVFLLICRIANNAVQCTREFEIESATWKVTPRFSKGTIVFDPVAGKAPPEVSGQHSLVFDH